ncbi:MAG: RDD family protein [bacterium]|nr:RDD family protein [bacterium]
MIDTVHFVQTPEGVELELRVAGPVVRAYAWLVDAFLRSALVSAFSIMLGVLGAFGQGILMVVFFVVWWFFPVFFEIYASGQTPGKKLMGLRVVQQNGTPVDWSGSILRNFLRVVDFLPFLYLIGLVSMLIDRSFRRLGDLAAATLVVYASTPTARVQEVPEVIPVLPPVPLALDEQRAVIAFVERSPFLTPERSSELAGILVPLLGDDEPIGRLGRIAAFLVGRSLPERP